MAKSPGEVDVVAVISGVVHVVVLNVQRDIYEGLKIPGPEKTKPPVGKPTGGREFSGWRPLEVGAGWVSGAPVAIPIPIIRVELNRSIHRGNPHSHSACTAGNAGSRLKQ